MINDCFYGFNAIKHYKIITGWKIELNFLDSENSFEVFDYECGSVGEHVNIKLEDSPWVKQLKRKAIVIIKELSYTRIKRYIKNFF